PTLRLSSPKMRGGILGPTLSFACWACWDSRIPRSHTTRKSIRERRISCTRSLQGGREDRKATCLVEMQMKNGLSLSTKSSHRINEAHSSHRLRWSLVHLFLLFENATCYGSITRSLDRI